MCLNEIARVNSVLHSMRTSDIFSDCILEAIHINSTLTYTDIIKQSLKVLVDKILESLLSQIDLRFADFQKFKFIELLNPAAFEKYSTTFPKFLLEKLFEIYNFFNKEELENELKVIYSDQNKRMDMQNLLKFFIQNELQNIFPETIKVLHLFLSLVLTTASCERSMSTLKRIKTSLRNSMLNDRLSNLSMMTIEKNLLEELSRDPCFIENVIDLYADKKNRRIDLMYKAI